MSRRLRRDRLGALLLALLLLAAAIVLAAVGVRMMPSYLAAWLFLLAFPTGALPLVMGMELAGQARSALLPPLRAMLVLLPIALLFAVPVLLRLNNLYYWTDGSLHGFPGTWFGRRFFIARMLLYLVIWTILAVIFLRPTPARAPNGRTALATLGLVLHFLIGTLAAVEWAMSVHLDLASTIFGPLLIAAQCGIAASAAVLLSRPLLADALLEDFATLVLVLASAWIFMHFMQFLVIWSADKPKEVIWYLHRSHGVGEAGEWLGLVAFVAALVLLLPRRFARRATLLPVAALLLLTHLFEMLWLITPSFRAHFTITWADAVTMLGAAAIASSLLLAFRPRAPGLVEAHRGRP